MNDRGLGIVSHDTLVKSLERAGLDFKATLAVEVSDRVLLDQQGNSRIAFDMPQVLTSWSRHTKFYEQLCRQSVITKACR